MEINFYEGFNKFKENIVKNGKKIVVVGGFVVSGCLIADRVIDTSNVNAKIENEVGYDDINPYLNGIKKIVDAGVQNDEFVILNIGDSKEVGVSNQDKKIEYCNENDISLGIIVTPTSVRDADIYDDVELVRGIINEYTVDFPVYLSIDNIIENNDIDTERKTSIIRSFMDKLTANGCYAALYGKDSNLVLMEKYCGIDEFDACVVMEKEQIEYGGTYYVYKGLDGKFRSEKDLTEIINNNNLNTKNGLKNDGKYVVREEDTLQEIAMMMGMPVNDLLMYNGITADEVKPGVVLKDPTKVEDVSTVVSVTGQKEYETLEVPIRGIDCSHYQVEEKMDWAFIKENFEFVILKCIEGNTLIDSQFEEFSTKCTMNDIPFGVYCFNGFRGVDYPEISNFSTVQSIQANACLNTIANKNVEYPVYLDIEVRNDEDIRQVYSPEQIQVMLDTWKNIIGKSGYEVGLYCNKNTFDYISSVYDTSDLEIWIASYNSDKNVSLTDLETPKSRELNYQGKTQIADMIQVSQYVTDTGAPTSSGYTDVNFSFIDYGKTIVDDEEYIVENGLEIKKIEREGINPLLVVGAVIGTGGIIAGIGHTIKKIKSRRVVRRARRINN